MPELVVSNTTPLSTLARVDLLDWIPLRLGRVLVPSAVWLELGFLRDETALRRLHEAERAGWIHVQPIFDQVAKERFLAVLDEGESEALVLATETGASFVWMDEAAGRALAIQLGLRVAGTAGMVVWAKRHGRIPAVRPRLEKLRTGGGLYLSDAFIQQLAEECGE